MSQPTRAAGTDPVDAVLTLLRADGGRATTARRFLLSVLFGNRAHRTAEEIAADVQARAPGTSRSTIYRNLDELSRLGVIDRIRLSDGPASYHLARAGHGHLACENCGTVTEIPAGLLADLARALSDRYGFTLSAQHFAVTGRCAQCRQATPPAPAS